jgi:hypothetical protein
VPACGRLGRNEQKGRGSKGMRTVCRQWVGQREGQEEELRLRMRIRYVTGTGVVKHESGVEQGLRLALYKGARELWARSAFYTGSSRECGHLSVLKGKGVPYLFCAVRCAGSYLQIRIG